MSSEPDSITADLAALDAADTGARFIRGSVMRVGTFGVNILASLISAPLVIRHLGPTRYGYFATVTAIVFIVGGFTEGGLNALGIREFASGRTDREELLRNLVGLRITATAVAIVVIAVGGALAGLSQVIVYGVLLGGGGLIVTIAGENLGIPLNAQLRLTAVSLLGLAQQVSLAATYIALVVLGARTLPFLGATLVSGGVLLVGTALLVHDTVSIVPSFDGRAWMALVRQTVPYAVASAVGIIYFREALVLMSILSTPRQVGYYGAAFRIVEVLGAIPWTIMYGAVPIFARAAHTQDRERLRYAVQRLFDTASLTGVWITGSILVGASFAIAVVAGPGFRPAVSILQIQGLAVLTNFMVALFGSVLLGLRLFRPLLIGNALAVAVATVLSLTLIPTLGAHGAAIAPTVAEACLAVVYAVSLRRQVRLRISLALALRALASAALGLGVVYGLGLSSLVSIIVFTVVYGAGLTVTRAVPFEVVNALVHRRR